MDRDQRTRGLTSKALHVAWCALACNTVVLAQQPGGVAQTVHNLSASGPGQVRAASEQEICVFCHAPHNTSGLRPLWNRELPLSNYQIYESSTLDAEPQQPTGASKLCLSCHDGTIALGNVLSRSDRIRISGGDYMPSGLTNLGTDLSDDHPVSFYYTSGIAASDRQLTSPAALPDKVRLDNTGQLQCTSCHDPHSNESGDFLVMSNAFGMLCQSCHAMNGWMGSSHHASTKLVAGAGYSDWPHATVAENACRGCHRQHAAGGSERLMIFEDEEANCLSCHDGHVSTNILAELDKLSAHDPRRYRGEHDAAEAPGQSRPHVECSDCHNPHAVAGGPDANLQLELGPTLRQMPGVNIGGAVVAEASREYEICFRCHLESAPAARRRIGRQAQSVGVRLQFTPNNPSYHPVVVPVRDRDTISLVTELPPGSTIKCSDCHNNNSGPRAGGSGPDGPHGSDYAFLLERNYTVADDNAESAFEYAMCYKCHQRLSILSDQSFQYHRLHIVDQRAPCSACHDPHGVSLTQSFGSDHTHLINFDTTIVRPHAATGVRRFRDMGTYAGSCTLQCHGVQHLDLTYGPGMLMPMP